jgi:heme/copper-type cytochrome/quinol oxidase subunit 2
MFRLGKAYDNYVFCIIIIKIIYIILALITLFFKIKIKNSKNNENILNIYNKLVVYKKILEFIFMISTALVCIIIFYPYYKDEIFVDKETKLLLFLFGFIIIITQIIDLY